MRPNRLRREGSEYEADMTVLGGLPVTIRFTVSEDDPSVGYRGGVEDWWITHLGGRRLANPAWLQRRIDSTPGEDQRIRVRLEEEEIDTLEWERD